MEQASGTELEAELARATAEVARVTAQRDLVYAANKRLNTERHAHLVALTAVEAVLDSIEDATVTAEQRFPSAIFTVGTARIVTEAIRLALAETP